MKKFIVTVTDDSGQTRKIIVPASGIFAAREMVKTFEKCPDSAIGSVLPYKPQPTRTRTRRPRRK